MERSHFSLLHPNLGRAFNNTFGFGLYEESLMYLAQDVAGWSLHSADRLRKLTKEKGKNPKKAQEWRAEFIRMPSIIMLMRQSLREFGMKL